MKYLLIGMAVIWGGLLLIFICAAATQTCKHCRKRKMFWRMRTVMVDVGDSGYGYFTCKGECDGTTE